MNLTNCYTYVNCPGFSYQNRSPRFNLYNQASHQTSGLLLYEPFVGLSYIISHKGRLVSLSSLLYTHLFLNFSLETKSNMIVQGGCTLALCWQIWRSLTAMKAREGLQWIVKKHNFSWTPCSKTFNNWLKCSF